MALLLLVLHARRFAWIEHVCDWELNRRQGLDLPLHPPEAAIEPSEDGDSVGAAMVMRESFAQDDRTDAVTALLDATVGLLTGGKRRHSSSL